MKIRYEHISDSIAKNIYCVKNQYSETDVNRERVVAVDFICTGVLACVASLGYVELCFQ